ncbi:MAG TPA: NADH-quinone oxidoreductase subunit L, partial [Candidatus Limnocylindrales bacterium]|nr:NADH-quinone oxidoreductase subunit L [Candidatus Limnocylindrales bacterium]
MDHPIPVTFIRLIVLLPLVGATINFLAGAWLQKTFGKQAISWIGCGVVILAFLLAVRAFHGMIGLPPENRFMLDDLWKWFDVGGLNLDIAFWLDPLSMIMTLIITGVGGLIHIYSTGYMHDDDGYWRFFGWLNLFTFAMLVLVLGDNMWLMFVGWEGVGLCSFALIGFWYKVQANSTAGNKAFIVNRIGDFGFSLAMFMIVVQFGSLNFATVFPAAADKPEKVLTTIAMLLLVGACGKSAQFPLYVWLPDAMEGPTPVSALIHAATMVTAGVYMVARSFPIYLHAPTALTWVAYIGLFTAVFAATIGLAQNDIKKVFAYSTVSQLGYMFLGVGSGAFSSGIYHLMTHAFFKALLFLGAGSVIHALSGEQDMRHMGGLRKKIPITFWTLMFAAVAISGI